MSSRRRPPPPSPPAGACSASASRALPVELLQRYVAVSLYADAHCTPPERSGVVSRVMTDFALSSFNSAAADDAELVRKMVSEARGKRVSCLDGLAPMDAVKVTGWTCAATGGGADAAALAFGTAVRYTSAPRGSPPAEATMRFSHRVPRVVVERMSLSRDPRLADLVFWYSILGFQTGQFWGVHPAVYAVVAATYARPIECFASPFNHTPARFFSPLPLLDGPHGSQGDFFSCFPGFEDADAFVVNPPFTEAILRRTMACVLAKLGGGGGGGSRPPRPFDVILYLPAWDDVVLPFVAALGAAGAVAAVATVHLQPRGSLVYDYLNRRAMTATFGTYMVLARCRGGAVEGPSLPAASASLARIAAPMLLRRPGREKAAGKATRRTP